MEIYQVGGAVRDKLLGLEVRDRDWVVTGATPEDMLDLGYKPVGRDFPVFIHPDSGEEYALARTERKTAPGYRGFEFDTAPDVTLEQDLMRRDITINAMARDGKGDLIDPYNGQADLEAGIIRHVSPAFIEDPLRVLRVARFAARFGFKIATETLELLKQLSAGNELQTLAPERVWTETEKALQSTAPGVYFDTLRECGALAGVFPELDRLFGVPQPEKYHPEIDTGIHTMMVLEMAGRLSDDTTVRFAALVHDLGKGTTPKDRLPAHPGHEERGVELVNTLAERLRIPNRYRELGVIVARHHLDCHRVREMRPATILAKLESTDALRRPDRFARFLLACEADARGRGGMQDTSYPQSAFLQRCLDACQAVDTTALTGSTLEGEQLGDAIRQLRIAAIQEVMDNAPSTPA